MTRLLIVLLALLAVPVLAQAPERLVGRVQGASARWATNEFGDQRIVTDLVIEAGGRTYDVTMDGGAIAGIGMGASSGDVPALGAAVELVWDRGHRRYRIQGGSGGYVLQGSRWPGSEMTWWLDTLYGELSPDVLIADTIQSTLNWTQQASIPFTMRYGGRLPDGTAVHALDYNNWIMFRPTLDPNSSSTLATAYWFYYIESLQFIDGDIIGWSGKVNWAHDACPGVNNATAFVEDVFTHEFGHLFGLLHSSVSGATMWPSYSTCSSALRSLSADDIAGVRALYGTGTPEPPPPPPPPPGPTCTLNGVTYQPGQQTTVQLRPSQVSGWLGAHPEWQFISSAPKNRNFVVITVECQPV